MSSFTLLLNFTLSVSMECNSDIYQWSVLACLLGGEGRRTFVRHACCTTCSAPRRDHERCEASVRAREGRPVPKHSSTQTYDWSLVRGTVISACITLQHHPKLKVQGTIHGYN